MLGFGKPALITEAAALKKGRCAVRGALRADEPVHTPLNNRACAAFYYKATYLAPSRLKDFVRRRLRDALVYGGGLHLELDGVRVELEPADFTPFTREDHLALKAEGIEGFDAREQLVRQGAEIFAHGKLAKRGEAWTMRLDNIELTPEEEARRASSTKTKTKTKRTKKKR